MQHRSIVQVWNQERCQGSRHIDSPEVLVFCDKIESHNRTIL